MKTTDSVIVSYDFTNGVDNSVLVVGHKNPKEVVEVINAFQGKEAEELWKKLTVRKEEKKVMKCKYHNPKMDELLSYCKALYKLPGCSAGGCLHILLDDDNYRDSDLEWCRQYCEKNAEGEERELAMKILDMYSAMDLTERTVFDWYLNGNNLECSDPTKCETCDLCEIPDYIKEESE